MLLEAFKALLRFQICVQRELVFSVDIRFLHLREGGIEVHGAELMNLVIRPGSLPAELVAGDVQDLQSLIMIVPVQLFYRGILGREAATGSRVNNQNDLALIIGQIKLFTLAGCDCIIIDHLISPFSV